MTSSNMTAEKKDFLRWFLKNYQLKSREAVWILNYLISDDRILNHVHFVDNAKHCPRGFVLTAVDCEGVPLHFYKNENVTSEAKKVFDDIRSNPTEPLYLQLNFQIEKPNKHYIAVWEENPYAPNDANLSQEEQQVVDEVINQSLVAFQRSQLLLEIDQALDERNESRFIELSNLLQTLH